MSELTRQELIEYCDAHDLKYHGNAGVNTLKAIVDEHMAGNAGGDDAPDVTPDLDGDTDQSDDDDQGGDNNTTPDPDITPDTDPEPITKKGEIALLNVGKNRHMVAGKTIAPGEGIVLTKKQCKDERLMAKVKTAIRCGVLEEVE